MALVLSGINQGKCGNKRNFEYMGNRFALINVTLILPLQEKSYMEQRPYHWRIGNGEAPPFDITLESRKWNLKEINFFIVGKKVFIQTDKKDYMVKEGIPIFKKGIFGDNCYYNDEEGNLKFTFYEDDLYCIFSESNFEFTVKLDESLECVFDSEKNLIGIILRGLKKDEIEVLKQADLV